jgi:hypothetical protein
MIIAALVSFGILLAAWVLAPEASEVVAGSDVEEPEALSLAA